MITLKHTPLLSVTVLNYNYGHFLATCLDSILKQTFTDFEVILINDKSTDNSLDVIQPYLNDPRVRLIDHTENKGFVHSLIEGCDLSRGKYITVISADDWSIDLTAFEKQIAVMEKDSEVAFVFTSYGLYAKEEHCTYIMRPSPMSYIRPGIEVFHDLLLGRPLHHSGTVIRKASYDAIGGYEQEFRHAVDAQMWLGLCHVGKVACIDEVLYAYRHHGANMIKRPEVAVRSISEMLEIVDWSFAMLRPEQRVQFEWLYKKAVRKCVSEWMMLHTFLNNNPRLGWYFFWIGLKLRPAQTIFQKTTIMLILRTILGMRGYRILEQLLAPFSGSIRKRLAANAQYDETGVSEPWA